MKQWIVPVRIVEHGRTVRVEADSKAEAAKLARQADWIECTDADRSDVFVAGPIEEFICERCKGNGCVHCQGD
jgi:hypothetical protein